MAIARDFIQNLPVSMAALVYVIQRHQVVPVKMDLLEIIVKYPHVRMSLLSYFCVLDLISHYNLNSFCLQIK